MTRVATIYGKRFKIAQNRGKPRVWIEGKFLLAAGIERGQKFNREISTEVDGVHFDTVFMRLEFEPDGKHTVAGTETRPIIDLNGAYLSPLFEGCTHYKAEICVAKGFEEHSVTIYIEGVR